MKRKKGIVIFLVLMVLVPLPGWGQQRETSTRPKQTGSLFPIYLEDNVWGRFKDWGGVRGWGYIDRSGTVIIPPQFTAAGHFSEGLAPVREGPLPVRKLPAPDFEHINLRDTEANGQVQVITRKWGYINENGEMVIKPQFDTAGIFSEGLARVKLNGKFGFIDKSGKIVINPQFDEAGNFSSSLALVRASDKYSYINQLGQVVIELGFNSAGSFSEGLAAVKIGNQYGYIDRTGRTAIKPQFAEAVSFSEGLAKVKINSKWGYIDKLGNVIIQPRFEDSGSFAEGLAEVKIGTRWGYIDPIGRIIIKPQFDDADSFSEGLASVKIKDQWGYINKQGGFAVTPQYVSAKPFYKGIGVVTKFKSEPNPEKVYEIWAYIDTKGQELASQRRHVFNIGAGFTFYLQVKISLWSRPTGAIVYLVPLYDWENDPSIINDDRKLWRHYVSQGNTDVETMQPEKVFIGVFVLNDLRKTIEVDVTKEGNTSFGINFR